MRHNTDAATDYLHAHFQSLYRRTKALWLEYEGAYPTWKCRFSILYGPPTPGPDLLIVGSNPGFNPDCLYDAEIETWPDKNEYTSRSWPLARKLRSTFDNAGLPDLLQNSVGTNRLFFKSDGFQKNKENGLGWGDNPLQVRRTLESFCVKEVGDLIAILQPKKILVLGMAVFDAMNDSVLPNAICSKGRRLFAKGKRGECEMVGIIHPTGAQISTVDWGTVTGALRDSLNVVCQSK